MHKCRQSSRETKMKKQYLRLIQHNGVFGTEQDLDIFEGDVDTDRRYLRKHHNAKARYFELGKEAKE